MRLIDADALIDEWRKAHNIGEDDCGAVFVGYSEIPRFVDAQPTINPQPHWIPILDGDGQMPEVDDEGYSDYILLSFRNASFLCIGQYRVDKEGGAFYEGDDEDPLTKIGLFVNAWMPLPEKYHDPL